jgi:hypothetical protein
LKNPLALDGLIENMVDTYYGHTSNDNVKKHSKNPTIESFSDKGYISS